MFKTFSLAILVAVLPASAIGDDRDTFLINPLGSGPVGQSAWKLVEKRATYGPVAPGPDICLDGWFRFRAEGTLDMICADGRSARAVWSIRGSQGDGRSLILQSSERAEFVLYTRAGAAPASSDRDLLPLSATRLWTQPDNAQRHRVSCARL
jgi:hypothetical protein